MPALGFATRHEVPACFASTLPAASQRVRTHKLHHFSAGKLQERICQASADGVVANLAEGSPEQQAVLKKPALKQALQQLKDEGMDDAELRRTLECWVSAEAEGEAPKWRDSALLLWARVWQLVIDLAAAAGTGAAAYTFALAGFPLHSFLYRALTVVSYYFLLSVVVDVARLLLIVIGSLFMGISTVKAHAAISSATGNKSGIAAVDKIQEAVATTRVLCALHRVRLAMKDAGVELRSEFGNKNAEDIGAYFLIHHAELAYGHDAVHGYELSEAEVHRAAATFATFDADQDYRLEASELFRLCKACAVSLSAKDLGKAMKMLDSHCTGFIEFDEFLSWWAGQLPPEDAKHPIKPNERVVTG